MVKSFEIFEKEANKKHDKIYSYIEDTFKNMTTPMSIKCQKHDIFNQKPSKHLHGQGCPKCIGRGLTKKEFITESQLKHNNKFTYLIDGDDNLIIKKVNKIKIKCPKHDIFEQTPSKHLYGQGCPKCNPSCKDDKSSFIEKFTKSFPEKIFDFEKIDYIDSLTKIKVKCDKNHLFEIRPNDLLHGHGCKLCANVNSSLMLKTSLNDLKEQIYNLRGNDVDTSKVTYYGTDTKCVFICNIHNFEYMQRPHNLLQGKNGCSQCLKSKQYSNAQIKWLNFIQLKDNITIQHAENIGEFKIPNTIFKADGYCQETNTIYEYHGDFWHGNPDKYISHHINPITKITFGELYQETLKREAKFRDMGFNLITIWESDWIKLNKCIRILQKKFLKNPLVLQYELD